jgi:hypothetical protein
MMQADLQAMLDREAIRRCVERLARGEDRRDAGLIRASWWPDATYDYGVQGGSFDEYLAWVVPGADAITNTQHVLGQTWTELAGYSAKSETHVISYHRVDYGAQTGNPDEHDTCIGGRYLDTFQKRINADGQGEWRIADRIMLYDWYQDWGASVDWSQGVMGLPFTNPRFPGSARSDYSSDWFAGRPM